MTKKEAMQLIDEHERNSPNLVALLKWNYLKVIINQITEEEWETLLIRATPTLTT